MSKIEWAEPPSRKNGAGKHATLTTALRERPGVWARVARDASPSTVGNWKRATAFQPLSDWEWRSVVSEPNSSRRDVYCRFVGDQGGAL